MALVDYERRRFCDLLLRYPIIHLNGDLIFARLQAGQRQRSLERDLFRIRIGLRPQLLSLPGGRARTRVYNLILDGRAVLLALFGNTAAIHPPPQAHALSTMDSKRRG